MSLCAGSTVIIRFKADNPGPWYVCRCSFGWPVSNATFPGSFTAVSDILPISLLPKIQSFSPSLSPDIGESFVLDNLEMMFIWLLQIGTLKLALPLSSLKLLPPNAPVPSPKLLSKPGLTFALSIRLFQPISSSRNSNYLRSLFHLVLRTIFVYCYLSVLPCTSTLVLRPIYLVVSCPMVSRCTVALVRFRRQHFGSGSKSPIRWLFTMHGYGYECVHLCAFLYLTLWSQAFLLLSSPHTPGFKIKCSV